ncbi:MAG: hypothetical protein K6A71_11475 [Lachnospiraceae bacterium]|nr:hypothetical protein [Lachnospiraceae bacterium]
MMRLRELAKNETKLLESFLYEAIFIPEGVEPPDERNAADDRRGQYIIGRNHGDQV